jgi:DNA polymerase elongation subunit (family B)
MRKKVKDELEHISNWPEPQGELRMIYWSRRMHSLSEKVVPKQTAKEVLQECISYLKDKYPDSQFNYDEDFFRP